MSSPHDPASTTVGDRTPPASDTTAAIRATIRSAVGWVAFWTAVCVPVLLVAVLASGIGSVTESVTFLSLIGLNLVALVVGRVHFEREDHAGDRSN